MSKGCPCACHGNHGAVYHVVPCHNPLLMPGDPSLPKTLWGLPIIIVEEEGTDPFWSPTIVPTRQQNEEDNGED